MRVLLDECLPRPLARLLLGHEVKTVPEAGWAGRSNGDLLSLAARTFDVFVTTDQNLSAQQNLQRLELGIIVLSAHTNRIQDMEPLVPGILKALKTIRRGDLLRLGG